MVNRTALKVGAVVVGAALLFLVVRTLVGWLFQLAMLVGVALLVVGLAYVAYRLWSASGDRDEATTADAGRGTAIETGPGDEDATEDVDGDDRVASVPDDEIERELERLREES